MSRKPSHRKEADIGTGQKLAIQNILSKVKCGKKKKTTLHLNILTKMLLSLAQVKLLDTSVEIMKSS